MPDFLRLNLAQLKLIWPDAAILVSDDRSERTEEIDGISSEVAFVTSNHRRGHCAGKVQSIVSGLSFAQQEGADILLFLNQRLVPVLPEFRELIETPFADKAVNIVVPGRSVAGKLKLPSSKYFSGLGILTDLLVIRIGSISPEQFLSGYTDGYKFGGFAIQILPEIFIGKLLGTHFGSSAFVSSALGDAKVEKLAFLRREQGKPEDYQALAAQHGFDGNFDCREWMELESNYMCRPVLTT
jgi:hypothetical protein